MATGDVAEAAAGFLPRFLGAVCGGAGSSCSDFLFLPGRDLGTRAGDTTCREVPRQGDISNNDTEQSGAVTPTGLWTGPGYRQSRMKHCPGSD